MSPRNRVRRCRRRDTPLGRLITGLLVLAAGVAFLLDRMGRPEGDLMLDWWPAAFLVLGIAALANRSWIGAAIWFVAGALLLMPKFGYERIGWWDLMAFWPLMFSGAGLVLIRHALRPPPTNVFGETAAVFRAGAMMGGSAHAVGSRDFLGGEAVAVMGGCDIDLRNAELRGEEAVVDVLAFWGGIGIKVPAGWTVEDQVVPFLGGMENRTSGSDGSKRLIVRGSAIMGGIEVSN